MEGLKNVFPFWTSRMARHTSWAEVCLSRNPTAPDSVAFLTYASSLCAESMSTLVAGTALSTWRVASRPLSSGMAMSINTTSGRSFLASATAWRPSCASPTTSRSSSSSSILRNPSRTIMWSSASRTVILFIIIQGLISAACARTDRRPIPGKVIGRLENHFPVCPP